MNQPANDNTKRIQDAMRSYLAMHPRIAAQHYRMNLKRLNAKIMEIVK